MSNQRISELTAKGAILESTDLIEISDYNGATYDTKSVTGLNIFDYCNPVNLLSAKVSLTAAQIKALATTPITLISTAGSGKAIDVIDIALRFNYGTAVFNHGTSDYKIAVYPSTESVMFVSAPILDSSTTTMNKMYVSEITNNSDIQIKENDSIVVACNNTGSNATLGDSTIDLYITYRIITL